jgi:hypothetical protein
MHRILASVLVSSFLALVVTACGGLDPDEAKTKCDMLRKANTNCFTDATYDQCLDCHQTCGTDCATAESCPVQFICPE